MKSTTVVAIVTNDGELQIRCEYQGYGGNWQNLGTISAGGSSQSSPMRLTAEIARSTNTYPINIRCTDSLGQMGTATTSVIISYTIHPADSAREDAKNSINDAKEKLGETEGKIKEAISVDVDVTNADASLKQANNYFTSAETDYNTAESSYAATDCDSAKSQYGNAKDNAEKAKEYATIAYNAAEKDIRMPDGAGINEDSSSSFNVQQIITNITKIIGVENVMIEKISLAVSVTFALGLYYLYKRKKKTQSPSKNRNKRKEANRE